MKRALWWAGVLLLALVSLTVLALNLKLYHQPGASPEAIVPYLDHQRSQLEAGAGQRMQQLFPEGYFFCYCLYGASWIDLAVAHPEVRGRALTEARWALAALESDQGRQAFAAEQSPPYGVFYVGWSNWLRGGILKLDPAGPERAQFEADCQALAEAFAATPFLEAYPGQAWPCDSTVGVASLALHDHLYEPRYQATIAAWLEAIDEHTVDGLLPHQVKPAVVPPRGTSQVMILRFLHDIDPEVGLRHYRLFRQRYVTTRLGLPGVREYPLGQRGWGDVDSGPLVFGFSFSSTGVGQGPARLYGDRPVEGCLGQLIDTFGVAWRGRFLLGAVPVADALLIWSRTAVSWTDQPPPSENWSQVVGPLWRWGFHLFWLIPLAAFWWLVWRYR
ncbi:MAG: hypothetical protein KC910_29545 [Candidatus Eremiobacteraeota bacterium]|nr:hypothetical protein [Candidatus Eremiobacteraeota bacterium]